MAKAVTDVGSGMAVAVGITVPGSSIPGPPVPGPPVMTIRLRLKYGMVLAVKFVIKKRIIKFKEPYIYKPLYR